MFVLILDVFVSGMEPLTKEGIRVLVGRYRIESVMFLTTADT